MLYYSRTGNTKKIAEKIAEEVGAEIERIKPKKRNKKQRITTIPKRGIQSNNKEKNKNKATRKRPEKIRANISGITSMGKKRKPKNKRTTKRLHIRKQKIRTIL